MGRLLLALLLVFAACACLFEVSWSRRKRTEEDRQRRQWADTAASIRSTLAANGRQGIIEDIRLRAVANQAHLDHLCQATATALGAPAAVITVVEIEGQRWLAHYGAQWCSDETRLGLIQPLETSYCKYVVVTDKPLVISDSFRDIRVETTSRTTREVVRAYLGAPVHAADGTPVGSLCVFDVRPRKWTDRDRTIVESFASLVRL